MLITAQVAMGIPKAGAFNLVVVFTEFSHTNNSFEPHKVSAMSSAGIILLIYR